MKYFVVSIQEVEDGTTAQSIFAYDNKDQAFSVYHQTLASNYAASSLQAFCTLIINEHGGTEVREFWDRPTPPPNAE